MGSGSSRSSDDTSENGTTGSKGDNRLNVDHETGSKDESGITKVRSSPRVAKNMPIAVDNGSMEEAAPPEDGGTPKVKKPVTLTAPSLHNQNNAGSDKTLVKMGTRMLRTKNCSEEFQSLDLGEPMVLGKFSQDKSSALHALALERFCLVESISVSGFSSTVSMSEQAERSDSMTVAKHDPADGVLLRISDAMPLFWLHASSAYDLHKGARKLREADFSKASVFICAADPVVLARPHDEVSGTQSRANKSVFFCLPALVRASPPSRSLYLSGRHRYAQLERDIKMSLIHLVAQDSSSNGTFPAYFGSKDSSSIGWKLKKIDAAFADNVKTSIGAVAVAFEALQTRIQRIQTVGSNAYERSCIPEAEINMMSRALLMNFYENASEVHTHDYSVNTNIEKKDDDDEDCDVGHSTATVLVTFENLSIDSAFVLLLSAISMTLQREYVAKPFKDMFEDIHPTKLNEIIRTFVYECSETAAKFDEFITDTVTRIFKGNSGATRYFTSSNKNNAIRYAYTFLFTYYCYDTFVKRRSSLVFSRWLRRHYLCYRSLIFISAPVTDILEIPESTYQNDGLYLIAESDGIPQMSLVSSDFGVQAHGFRKIPPAPVYGAQNPATKQMKAIVDYCSVIGKRWRHTQVVWCDLRMSPVLYLDGIPYVICNRSGQPISEKMVVYSGEDLLKIEDRFKSSLFNAIKPIFAKRHGTTIEVIQNKQPPKEVLTPKEMAESFNKPEDVKVVYFRLPTPDEKAPSEECLQSLVTIVTQQNSIFNDEDGPAFLFTCASGVGAVTSMMIAATLINYHINGFPYGCHVGEEERVSIKNVQYTQGNFQAVRELVEQIPRGNQVKREVDAVLDACWDRMTATFYHLREIIFATFSRVWALQEEPTAATNDELIEETYRHSVDYLERYVLLIIFNAYLHSRKHENGGWQSNTFQASLSEMASTESNVIAILDNLCFQEFGDDQLAEKCRHIRDRWLKGSVLKKKIE